MHVVHDVEDRPIEAASDCGAGWRNKDNLRVFGSKILRRDKRSIQATRVEYKGLEARQAGRERWKAG